MTNLKADVLKLYLFNHLSRVFYLIVELDAVLASELNNTQIK
jgi:hypothetical protein